MDLGVGSSLKSMVQTQLEMNEKKVNDRVSRRLNLTRTQSLPGKYSQQENEEDLAQMKEATKVESEEEEIEEEALEYVDGESSEGADEENEFESDTREDDIENEEEETFPGEQDPEHENGSEAVEPPSAFEDDELEKTFRGSAVPLMTHRDIDDEPIGEGNMSDMAGLPPRHDRRRRLPPPLPLYKFVPPQESVNPVTGSPTGPAAPAPPKSGTGAPMLATLPKHILWEPEELEPMMKPRDGIQQEMSNRDAQRLGNPASVLNRVVYDCLEPNPKAEPLLGSPSAGGGGSGGGKKPKNKVASGDLRPYYIPEGPTDSTLMFESRFESGNLRRAIQLYENEYDLILKPDFNTRGHTQWYYFSVQNAKPLVKYKFNVINLVKPDSLYNKGMRVLYYSELDAAKKGYGWRRWGHDICYYQNHIKRKNGYYYTLTFSFTVDNENDTCYFAYCYPYTYSDLCDYLTTIENDPKRRNRMRRRPMCQTLAGNNCDLLTITSFACDPEALKARKGVVVSARVHPGETNASWMMKGVIDYLTGPSLDAKILRENFVFKIIPMLNPDGVINGNYRCSLAGVDLNRQWLAPPKKLLPTIYHTKQMLKRFQEDRDVIIFCDLHGHSRKCNIFMYGCQNKNDIAGRLRERVFPRILWKNGTCFSFNDSSFKVQKSKEATARIVVWKEVGISNSYTMEASFAGPNFGSLAGKHFNCSHLERMGHVFCNSILDYCDPDQSKVHNIRRELDMLFPAREIPTDDDDDNESAGSDENPSEDNEVSAPKRLPGTKSKKKVKRASSLPSKMRAEKERGRAGRSSSTTGGGNGSDTSVSSKKRGGAASSSERSKRKGGTGKKGGSGSTSAGGTSKSEKDSGAAGSSSAGANSSGNRSGATSLHPTSSAQNFPRFPFPYSRAYLARLSEYMSEASGSEVPSPFEEMSQREKDAVSEVSGSERGRDRDKESRVGGGGSGGGGGGPSSSDGAPIPPPRRGTPSFLDLTDTDGESMTPANDETLSRTASPSLRNLAEDASNTSSNHSNVTATNNNNNTSNSNSNAHAHSHSKAVYSIMGASAAGFRRPVTRGASPHRLRHSNSNSDNVYSGSESDGPGRLPRLPSRGGKQMNV